MPDAGTHELASCVGGFNAVTCAQVDGHPFYFAGWNNYYLPQYSADPNGNYERGADVDASFRWSIL